MLLIFKSYVYVTLNAIGSFQCNLCSHWLIQILLLKFLYEYGPCPDEAFGFLLLIKITVLRDIQDCIGRLEPLLVFSFSKVNTDMSVVS